MKKTTFVTGALIIVGSFIGSSTFAADTTTNQNHRRDRAKTYKSQIIAYSGTTLPSYSGWLFMELSADEHTALKAMTDSERKAFLEAKWVILPETRQAQWANNRQYTKLTDDEQAKLENMTEAERKAFIEAKLSGNTGMIVLEEWVTNSATVTKSSNTERQARIEKRKSDLLEQKKQKIQKKILAWENLTRLEKKFAMANGISYE